MSSESQLHGYIFHDLLSTGIKLVSFNRFDVWFRDISQAITSCVAVVAKNALMQPPCSNSLVKADPKYIAARRWHVLKNIVQCRLHARNTAKAPATKPTYINFFLHNSCGLFSINYNNWITNYNSLVSRWHGRGGSAPVFVNGIRRILRWKWGFIGSRNR